MPPAEFFNGFHSNVTSSAPSPSASTYNLGLSAAAGEQVSDVAVIAESRVLIIMTGIVSFLIDEPGQPLNDMQAGQSVCAGARMAMFLYVMSL